MEYTDPNSPSKAMVFQEVLLRKKVSTYNSSFIPYLTSYQGLRIDARAGLDYLTSHPLFKNTPIVSAIHFNLLELDTTVLKDSIRAIDGRCSCN